MLKSFMYYYIAPYERVYPQAISFLLLHENNEALPISTTIQSTLVISNSKGLYETLRDIRTSTYQICGNEENN